jgi:hypothetical protein
MANSATNRPLKYGAMDRKEYISEDSEVALRAQNDSNGNPVYLGRAKPGVLTSETKWQIRFLTYDANQGVTSVTWPQDDDGLASSDYIFEWDERASYTYS